MRGERGTAKSTAVRALAPLLPPVAAAAGQALAFAPGERSPSGPIPADAVAELRPARLVELPLGATLDRLVGALDLAQALDGRHAFEPGLLARAHQGILYVDEVNLLPDHLVDALLDAAASGVARIEREALSAEHDARFQLVGTMNLEEGELRPQLLDRFGLAVTVAAAADPAVRAEIVGRQLAFDRDRAGFARSWADAENALRARIAAARDLLGRVGLPERELHRITAACARLGIDSVRGDIACARAARALAALDGAPVVDERHVREAARLALPHRRHRDPLDAVPPEDDDIDRALDGDPPDDGPRSGPVGGAAPESGDGGARVGRPAGREGSRFDARSPAPRGAVAPAAAALPAPALRLGGAGRGPSGRRARSRGPSAGSIDSRPAAAGGGDVAIVDTLVGRLAHGDRARLREHVRSGREGALLVLVIDASGSMGARRRLARVKGAVLAMLRDAHGRRDRVAIVAVRDGRARVLVPAGAPLARAAAAVRDLPAGGRTPLAAAMGEAERLIGDERVRDPQRRAIALVLTDGRSSDDPRAIAAAARRLGALAGAVHVIDAESGPVRLGLAGALAAAAGGRLHPLDPPTPSARRAA